MKMKTKTKMKTKNKNENEKQNVNKNEIKIKMNFHFCFYFVFHFHFGFWFCFLQVFASLLTPRGLVVPQTVNCLLIGLEVSQRFCIFVKSTWPRGAIDGQLSLTWPRSAIAFSFANSPRRLAVPQMINSLLIGLELPQHLEIWHLA